MKTPHERAATARLAVLDTATETLHLGMCEGDREWVLALPGGAASSSTLLPALLGLLDDAGLPLKQLDAIGFGRGPGAFTGVRTACAVTQGLAFGAELPVLALDTLMAVAEDARRQGAGDELWVAVDARMGEAYAARYRHVGGAWQTIEAPALHSPVALAVLACADPVRPEVAGNSLTAHEEAWAALTTPRWPLAAPRAAALLALARSAWAHGDTLDVSQALPLYVRDKVAQTTAERAAGALR